MQRRLLVLIVWLVSLPAMGGELPSRWELVVDVALRSGGDVDTRPFDLSSDLDPGFAFGLSARRMLTPETAIDFGYAHREASFDSGGITAVGNSFGVDVDSFQLGTIYAPLRQRARPFVGVALGLTRFSPEPGGFDSEVPGTVVVSGGVTLPVSDKLGLRFTGRGWFYLGNAELEGRCGPQSCTVELFASGAFEAEAAVGLVFRLGGR